MREEQNELSTDYDNFKQLLEKNPNDEDQIEIISLIQSVVLTSKKIYDDNQNPMLLLISQTARLLYKKNWHLNILTN